MKRLFATIFFLAVTGLAQEVTKSTATPSTLPMIPSVLTLSEPEAMKGELFQTRIEKIDIEVQLLQVRFRQLQEDRQAAQNLS